MCLSVTKFAGAFWVRTRHSSSRKTMSMTQCRLCGFAPGYTRVPNAGATCLAESKGRVSLFTHERPLKDQAEASFWKLFGTRQHVRLWSMQSKNSLARGSSCEG